MTVPKAKKERWHHFFLFFIFFFVFFFLFALFLFFFWCCRWVNYSLLQEKKMCKNFFFWVWTQKKEIPREIPSVWLRKKHNSHMFIKILQYVQYFHFGLDESLYVSISPGYLPVSSQARWMDKPLQREPFFSSFFWTDESLCLGQLTLYTGYPL